MKRVLDMLFLLLVPSMCVLVGLSHVWIPFVYGRTWLAMSSVMTIIVIPYLIMAMLMIVSSLLSSLNLVRISFLFYAVYNLFYWPALIAATVAIGFYGAPATDWIALFAISVLLFAKQSIPLRWNVLMLNMAKATIAGGAIILLRQFSLSHPLLVSLMLCGFIIILWVALSPAKKELISWAQGRHALDVER